MKVLVTGASGYIGRQLADKLSAAGHDVTCMVRNAARPPRLHSPQIKFVEADALQAETLPAALKGIDVAYYLIHSMSGQVEGFELRDCQAAHNFATAAKQCGVRRVISRADTKPARCCESLVRPCSNCGPALSLVMAVRLSKSFAA
jgi:uncharacterized protein YbjT (DUF2867 family)